jgi:hypothetical protein
LQTTFEGDVIVQNALESESGGLLLSEIGGNFYAANGAVLDYTNQENGNACLSDGGGNGYIRNLDSDRIIIDPNFVTIEFSHKCTDLTNGGSGVDMGLFLFAEAGQDNNRLQIALADNTGAVKGFYNNQPNHASSSVQSPAGVITENVWHKIALVMTGREMILFVDGVEVGRDGLDYTQWQGDFEKTEMAFGRSRGGAANRYMKGFIDNIRVTAGPVYLSDYTPTDMPFDVPNATPDTVTTIHQMNFESDITTAVVGSDFVTSGSPVHDTTTPIYENGSLKNTTAADYIESIDDVVIDSTNFTVEASISADDLTNEFNIWSIGRFVGSTDYDRFFLRVRESGAIQFRLERTVQDEKDASPAWVAQVLFNVQSADGVITAGQPYDVAADVYRENGISHINIYVDGVVVATGQAQPYQHTGPRKVRLGFTFLDFMYFTGRIDEYRLSTGARYKGRDYTPVVPLV